MPEGGTYVGGGSQAYDASFGGTNANTLCTADQAKTIWTKYFQEPIQIPGLAGGIDIAGGPKGDGASGFVPGQSFSYDPTKETWTGATVEDAEKILCQGTADSIYYGITNTLGWGNGCPLCELSVLYNTNSRQITDLLFQYGYQGTIDATSVDGKTKFSISLNNVPIQETTSSGTNSVILNWSDTTGAFNGIVNQIYDAIRNTYTPTFPADQDCIAAGHCVIGNNYSQGGYLFFTSLNLSIFVTNTLAPQPAASTPSLIDLGLLKLLPFSIGSTLMKLDPGGEGPLSITKNVEGSGKDCTYKLGMTFGDFDSNCLEPLPSPSGDAANTIAKNKLFGAMAHSDEAFEFDISGIDPQFVAKLQPGDVIGDKQLPSASDVAYELTVDQFEIGTIANDFTGNDPTQPQDLHGLGMITLEWANNVQQYMRNNYGVTSQLGDPECIVNPASPGAVAAGDGGAPAKKCSGIEGIITSAPPALAPAYMAVNALGVNALNVAPEYATGLKPGTWYSIFCSKSGDPTTGMGFGGCSGGHYGGALGGYYFDQMQSAVAASFGANPVPTELQSRRFYFKQWILAVIKYFETADNPSTPLSTIDTNPVDPNQVFFDTAGGGFENGNYIFRNSVNTASQPPTVLNVSTNLTTSVVNNFTFARYNFRGDTALYDVLNTSPSKDKPGAEPLYLSNLAGSPVLKSVYSSYACATNTDPHNMSCKGIVAPIDPLTNQPLFQPYEPAFGQSALAIAANGSSPFASSMTVDPTGYELIQSAKVTIPIWSNPFDPTSATASDKTVSVLLPYVPKGAGVGFPVTIDGSRDKFYNTNETVFTSDENLAGSTFESVVDWEYTPVSNGDGGTNNILVVRAIETQSFLGLIFACAQPSPTQTGAQDILAVRMYENASDILGWIGQHPGATAACGIQIKYSIYGNYPDFISFNNNGVRLGLNPGFGGAVVSDGTLFDPNVVAALGQ